MFVERLPPAIKTPLRRVVLQVRIPLNQARALINTWIRRWFRWWTSDPTRWHTVDLARNAGINTGIYCISLLDDVRYQSRRRLFQHWARKSGWPVELWPAVDGSTLQAPPDWLKEHVEGRDFSAGAIGLLLTTRKLYQHALAQGWEFLAIFEDDGVIHGSPKLELPVEFDLVFLNNRVQGDYCGRVKIGWGTDGYIISRRGLKKMLTILDDASADIDMLIMMHTKSLAERNQYLIPFRNKANPQLECFQVGPLVTHAGYFPSSISGR